MLRRIALLGVILCWSAAPGLAQLHKIFPWFHPAEPAIDRQVYVSRAGIRIDGGRIGILPFPARQGGEPVPPPFASYLRNALFASSTPGSVVDVPDPVEFLAGRERSYLSESRRTVLALDHCKAARVDLLAVGRMDAVFRTASGGMTIKIRAQLWDVESRTPVWSGRVALDWTRRYSLEDCLLRAAITLVEEWTRAAEPESKAGL